MDYKFVCLVWWEALLLVSQHGTTLIPPAQVQFSLSLPASIVSSGLCCCALSLPTHAPWPLGCIEMIFHFPVLYWMNWLPGTWESRSFIPFLLRKCLRIVLHFYTPVPQIWSAARPASKSYIKSHRAPCWVTEEERLKYLFFPSWEIKGRLCSTVMLVHENVITGPVWRMADFLKSAVKI